MLLTISWIRQIIPQTPCNAFLRLLYVAGDLLVFHILALCLVGIVLLVLHLCHGGALLLDKLPCGLVAALAGQLLLRPLEKPGLRGSCFPWEPR
jgi:hypothetical protein